jgi:TolB-like protein/DNA-binding winged helix-turn-helix (wHTH) protein
VSTPIQSRILKFALFEVDLEAGELRKSGMRQKLAAQPFEVLHLLLERPQEIVTREELQKRIWPKDTFVDYDLALRKAITRLREVLGDSAESPRFIETVPRRGYRFIAPLSEDGAAGAVAELPASTNLWSRRGVQIGIVLGLGAGALVLALLGLMPDKRWWRRSSTGAAPEIRSLAVLPLQNLSADLAQEYFSDGMTDALITDLAQIGSLKVISRTSSMQYKQTKKSLPAIARELNVDGIVEGTVQHSGDRVRITAQLIDGRSDKHLWANTYERETRDIFALEQEVTDDIAHQVRAHVTAENQVRLMQSRPVNLEALEAYLQGNSHLIQADMGPRDEELRKAAEYFQKAIDADPAFAPAYVGLAEAHHTLWWISGEDFAIRRASAERALELNPASSDARLALGFTKDEDFDWTGAEEQYRLAIAINPNSASAHENLGNSLDTIGRLEEGWKEYQNAQELDPNQDHLSSALYRRGEHDRAIEILRSMGERNPQDGLIHWNLSENFARKGLYKEWDEELGKAATQFGLPEVASRLHRAFVTSGYPGALRQWAAELEHLRAKKQAYFPGVLAKVYAALGDKERAFYWLEQGCDSRYLAGSDPILQFLKVDPGFTSLRSDPRFKDLLRRMGLPP